MARNESVPEEIDAAIQVLAGADPQRFARVLMHLGAWRARFSGKSVPKRKPQLHLGRKSTAGSQVYLGALGPEAREQIITALQADLKRARRKKS